MYPVIKAGKDSGIYLSADPLKLSDTKIDMADLPAELEKLRKKYGTIVYFREGAYQEPSGEFFSHVKSVLEAIIKSGLNIMLGDKYVKAFGEITNFTLHIAPDRFRFGIDKGVIFVYAFIPPGKDKWIIYKNELIERKFYEDVIARDLGMVFHSNRLGSVFPNKSEYVLEQEHMKKPSVHISVVLNGEYQWKSYYDMDEIPGNVLSFIDDCKALGRTYIESSKKRSKP
jgi:hypothetical protein